MAGINERDVLGALKSIVDPDLGRDIVSLGFVKNIKIEGGKVSFDLELTTPACPIRELFQSQSRKAVLNLPGVKEVDVRLTARVRQGSSTSSKEELLSGVKNVIAVASGKGGVGKSTTSVNLALALQQTGAKVGLLDADVYGPSIPLMMGLTKAQPEIMDDGRMKPVLAFGVKVISMGFLTDADTPVVWRGPLASRVIQDFLAKVEWGELDYLLIDLPPGTGDIQLTLCQSVPLTGAVVVSTPQDAALNIARKGIRMFQQVKVPILGLLENMSYFVCPHCQARSDIFSHGGVSKACQNMGIPFLGEIPLDPGLVLSGDQGKPLVGSGKKSQAASAFQEAAGRLASQASKVNIETSKVTVFPVEVKGDDEGQLMIKWSDGHESTYQARRLRFLCPCAGCVDEMTGQRLLKEQDLPQKVTVLEVSPTGRYGLQFKFSDGHTMGIYSFSYLRQLCVCGHCPGLGPEGQGTRKKDK